MDPAKEVPAEAPKKKGSKTEKWAKFNPFEPSTLYTSTLPNSPEPVLRESPPKTEVQMAEHAMTCYKRTFLPAKRDMYGSIYKGNLNPYSQRANFVDPKDLQKQLYGTEEKQQKLVDFLVNGSDYDFESELGD